MGGQKYLKICKRKLWTLPNCITGRAVNQKCLKFSVTLNFIFIPRWSGCNFWEQADGIIARHAPWLTMNFWLTGFVWVWKESAINKLEFGTWENQTKFNHWLIMRSLRTIRRRDKSLVWSINWPLDVSLYPKLPFVYISNPIKVLYRGFCWV